MRILAGLSFDLIARPLNVLVDLPAREAVKHPLK